MVKHILNMHVALGSISSTRKKEENSKWGVKEEKRKVRSKHCLPRNRRLFHHIFPFLDIQVYQFSASPPLSWNALQAYRSDLQASPINHLSKKKKNTPETSPCASLVGFFSAEVFSFKITSLSQIDTQLASASAKHNP